MKVLKGIGIGVLSAAGLTVLISYLVHFVKGGYPWNLTDYTVAPIVIAVLLAVV